MNEKYITGELKIHGEQNILHGHEIKIAWRCGFARLWKDFLFNGIIRLIFRRIIPDIQPDIPSLCCLICYL